MSKVAGRDVREGVEREDKRLRDKLLDLNFVNNDSHSRPCNAAYAEGWDRIFGKKSEPSDKVNTVTEMAEAGLISAEEARAILTVQLNHVDGRIEHVEVAVDDDAGQSLR